MATYKYEPLGLDGSSTRLLRLLRGDFKNDIQCDLFEGRIRDEESMPYKALSYTWGTTEKNSEITVNGSIMPITLNLYEALQHLRTTGNDEILWVDAICIDQNNDLERSHQVRQMSSIYKGAEEVVVWLGGGTKETDIFMDCMKQLHESAVQQGGDWRLSAQLWLYHQAEIQSTFGQATTDPTASWREGLGLILSRPWFRRIWVLQEIANARVATILCGSKSVSSRTFAQAPSLIGLKPSSHCQALLDIMPGLSRKESWWAQQRDLQTLLIKFCESDATDKRDIIYALLGISSDADQSDILLPDYTKSLPQVLQDTGSFLVFHKNQEAWVKEYFNSTLPQFLTQLDSLGSRVLGIASANGDEAMVKLLLETDAVRVDGEYSYEVSAAARIKVKEVRYSQTPLWRAAEGGHVSVVQLLLEHGADINVKDYFNRTPLFIAARNRHGALVRTLLKHGAKTDIKDTDGGLALSAWAAMKWHMTIVFVQGVVRFKGGRQAN
ncbi:hypothetical protein EG329_001280 [Mollisiaceae sp. DMI_Dod_QoI]|nr:hypothetical protein EG329_001280 [Helotiales sp. DMI_Dod_QoI]